MRPLRQLATGLMLGALLSSSAWAQTPSPSGQPPATPVETRPATTSVYGDTGLWFVPTGEVLPKGRWSASGYYINWDRTEAFTDIAVFRVTFGYGASDRVELFGNVDLQRRVDADRRPVRVAGAPMDDPNIFDGWTTGFGDIQVGAKYNLLAPWRQQPSALAVRGGLKLPTADYDKGLGSGFDIFADFIASAELRQRVEISGYGGINFRSNPDEYELSNGFRWGFGAGFPSRKAFRVTTEIHGEAYFDGTIVSNVPTVSGSATSWDVDSPADLAIGFTYQHPTKGWFIGYGISYGLNTTDREDVAGANFQEDSSGDRWGSQVRIGWHPGVRIYVPPPPPPAATPAAAPAPANRAPTARARCEPCVVEIGKTATVTADAQDPDGDSLSYKWSAPAGTFGNAAERQTIFTCAQKPGSIPVTVSVSDGKGGTASDTVTIQCVEPPRREWKFEDVHFDFDRYSLRPEALRILDEAVKAMQADPTLRLTIEGHTDSIGTNEYNLALGERRANSAREYLASRGIAADRINTVSYGEERPRHDNSREETRRLNRRAALTVRLQ